MPKFLISLFTELASIIGGGVNGALGIMTSLIGKGFSMAVQFHEEGIAFAREVGLNAKEAQAYTQVLTERTERLALKYGIAAEAIREVQRGIVDATGKQYMLNEAEAERQVQINKLVGAGTANQFTEQMMNHMGAQLSTVQGAVSKAYATAAKSGLNAAKFSKEVAKNLSLANKLSFRDGVNGIIRMTALSEKLGFNLQSVESAANKFMDLDSAIESSAQLQMLGGAAGAYGSNPLTMAYEANYDPEAFTKRMTDMLGGYAHFDKNSGMAKVGGMNMDFVRNIAKAMGISADEAVSIAKKQAEIKYKENAYAPELGRIKNQEQRDFILNKSYVDTKTGQLMINDIHGQAHNISENGIDGIIDELQKFDNMSEKDIMQRQAETLTSINDQIKGIGASFMASIAKYLNQYLPGATTAIKDLAKEIQPHIQEIGRNVGDFAKTVIGWAKSNKDTIKDVVKGVFGIASWLTKHWPILLGLWAGKKVLGNLPLGLSKSFIGARAASGGIKTVLKGIAKGGTLGIFGALGNYTADKLAEDGKIEKGGTQHSVMKIGSSAAEYGGLGAAIGSVIPGIGTAVGGGIGAAVGTVKGGYDTWKSMPENIDKGFFDFIGAQFENIKKFVGSHFSKTIEGVTNLFKTISGAFSPVGNGIMNGITKVFGGIGKVLTDLWKHTSPVLEEIVNVFDIIFGGIFSTLSVWLGAVNEFAAKPDVSNFFNGVFNFFGGLWKFLNPIFEATSAVVKTGFKFLGGFFESIFGLLQGNTDPIKKNFNGMINWFKELPGVIWDWIRSQLPKWAGGISEEEYKAKQEARAKAREEKSEPHANGGIVGGNSYSGDRILTGLNSGEMVLNKDQQAQLFKFIQNASSILTKIGSSNGVTYYNASNRTSNSLSNNTLNNILSTIFNSTSNVVSSALNTNNSIKTIPFGDNSFRKIPKSDYTEYSYNKGGEISVKDINLNVNGTLKLDTRGFIKDLDVSQLLNDTSFVSQLKELIKQSINSDINGGRLMNDNAVMRGMPAQTTLWGRK